MTTAAIMQPTYLPWIGYFDLIDQADVFVLLDNVPVARQSWQTRNRIRRGDGTVVWLSVPTRARFGQQLDEVEIANDRDWQTSHLGKMKAAYGSAPHWATAAACFIDVTRSEHCATIANLTTKLIRETAMMLGIQTRIVRASALARQRHGRVERLADILQSVGADEFLQTAGGRVYLGDATVIGGVPIRYHEYEHPVYDQGGAEFMPYLSVVDLLAWHGPGSLYIIRSGRGENADQTKVETIYDQLIEASVAPNGNG